MSEKRLEADDDDGEKKEGDIWPVSTARAWGFPTLPTVEMEMTIAGTPTWKEYLYLYICVFVFVYVEISI